MFTIEQVKKLHYEDPVYLTKWRNRKDGGKTITTQENCLFAGQNEKFISFRNITGYYKDARMDHYGLTWCLEPAYMSYASTTMKENGD